MFQVLVVENSDERHLATAGWAFPLYLHAHQPVRRAHRGGRARRCRRRATNPDLFVLTVPLASGSATGWRCLVFLGGFSAATSMVIVAALALSTMLSNHIIMPLWLRADAATMTRCRATCGAPRLTARRLSIAVACCSWGYGYYRLSGGADALADIGLIAFLGRGADPAGTSGRHPVARGDAGGGGPSASGRGSLIWAWLLLIPNVAETGGLMPPRAGGRAASASCWLSPATPLGLQATDPLLTAMVLSLGSEHVPLHFRFARVLPQPA
jgi:hypothetical protein